MEKRKLSNGVLQLHDNAPVHTADVSTYAVRQCGFTELDHPPYRPDMAYYLFTKFKAELKAKKIFK